MNLWTAYRFGVVWRSSGQTEREQTEAMNCFDFSAVANYQGTEISHLRNGDWIDCWEIVRQEETDRSQRFQSSFSRLMLAVDSEYRRAAVELDDDSLILNFGEPIVDPTFAFRLCRDGFGKLKD